MASPDLVIGYHKLDTEFFTGHVQHTTFRSDASKGKRRVRVVKKWYRGRELGRGSFGTVFLETSEKGECRAVKEIAKDKNSTIKIHYKRELMAMAILAKHDDLFVQLFGWYESDNYIHIAMEYISHGHLRNYLEVERSESEAKVITRQLLEGLVVIHQEGFAHRDLKPENIFVVSTSPVWVKIGDFGLAKLARDGTAFRTQAFSSGYFAPEAGIATGGDSSEYTNAVDIWAVGCIAHEVLTRVLPFRNFFELSLYCTRPEFPRNSMLLKNISPKGMEIVESMLALPPERRIAAKEALDSEWLRLEDEGQEGLETEEDSAGPALPEVLAPPVAEVANGDPLPGRSKEGLHNCVTITVDVMDQRTTEVLLLELKHRLQVGFLGEGPIDEEMPGLAKHFDMLESLGRIDGGTVGVGEQAAIDSIRLADVAVLIRNTEITGVLGAIIELPSVPRDEEYQFRKRSTDLLQKWNELISPSDKNQAPTSASPAVKKEGGNQNGSISAQVPPASPAVEKGGGDQSGFISAQAPSASPTVENRGGGKKGSGSAQVPSASPVVENGGVDQNGSVSAQVPSASPAVGEKNGQNGLISARTSARDAEESVWMAKYLVVNGPSTHAGTPVDSQAEGATVSRYPYAFSNPKPHANIDADVKRLIELVLEEIQESTDSPQKPMLSDKDAAHMLLSGVISMDIRDSAGNTPLHVAINRLPVIRIVRSLLHVLVASGADVNARNSEGKTPLFLAVSRSLCTAARKLLELGANAEEPDLDGIRPLMKAVQEGSATLTALLLNHGAFAGTIQVTGTTQVTGTIQVEQRAVTPLHAAARLESDTICQLILQRGANVNARDFMEQTPLHGAVIHGHLVVAGSLIAAGAEVGAMDNLQRTALGYAVARNSVPLVELLLDHGANPDAVDECGISPRQVAVRADVPEIVTIFDRVPAMR